MTYRRSDRSFRRNALSAAVTTAMFGAAALTHAQVIELSGLDGSSGFALRGNAGNDRLGGSVSSAGDVNGDGIDDVIAGATDVDPGGLIDAGRSYVLFGGTAARPPSINVTTLNGVNGFALTGVNAGDFSGSSVSDLGDVNDDGIDDFVVGALDGNYDEGAAYVVFGTTAGFNADIALSSLDGSNGFVILGAPTSDAVGGNLGDAAGRAGDVNADGIDDIIVGAPTTRPGGLSRAGQAFVVFGSNQPFPASVPVATLNGSDGFSISAAVAHEYVGTSVAGAGDVNGDGIDDVIVGAPRVARTYVVFGSDAGFPADIPVTSLNGSNGFRIIGVDGGDQAGTSVSAAGDVNGDGVDDVIIGAPEARPPGVNAFVGESYVLLGNSAGFPASVSLATLNGSNGVVLRGIDSGDRTGRSVKAAGDVNGDGIDDVIVGARDFTDFSGHSFMGRAYVVFGKAAASLTPLFPYTHLNGSNGFILSGATNEEEAGWSVSGAGDVNGDGVDDLVVGAINATPPYRAGAAYVVFGSDSGFDFSLGAKVNGARIAQVPKCQNLTTGQNVQGRDDPSRDVAWTCEGMGLDTSPSDSIRTSVIAVATAQEPIGGIAFGLASPGPAVICSNLTTTQSVTIPPSGSMAWDCEAAGLVVAAGNLVRMAVNGAVK